MFKRSEEPHMNVGTPEGFTVQRTRHHLLCPYSFQGRCSIGRCPYFHTVREMKAALSKSRLCRFWEAREECPFGSSCTFSHGVHELRTIESTTAHQMLAMSRDQSIHKFQNRKLQYSRQHPGHRSSFSKSHPERIPHSHFAPRDDRNGGTRWPPMPSNRGPTADASLMGQAPLPLPLESFHPPPESILRSSTSTVTSAVADIARFQGTVTGFQEEDEGRGSQEEDEGVGSLGSCSTTEGFPVSISSDEEVMPVAERDAVRSLPLPWMQLGVSSLHPTAIHEPNYYPEPMIGTRARRSSSSCFSMSSSLSMCATYASLVDPNYLRRLSFQQSYED